MSEIDLLAEAQRWLRYAEEDLRTARALVPLADVPPRNACYHAQQAAEKALKAVLLAFGLPVPRTHDLQALRLQLPPSTRLMGTSADLDLLSLWAVEPRYPGDAPEATLADATTAVSHAEVVVNEGKADVNDLEPEPPGAQPLTS